MSAWFRCQCGQVLRREELNIHVELETSEFWGQLATTSTEVWTCPTCASESLEEFFPCPECVRLGQNPPAAPVEGADHCDRHLEE